MSITRPLSDSFWLSGSFATPLLLTYCHTSSSGFRSGAGGEVEVVHRLLQQGVGLGFELAVLADEFGGHGAVGGDRLVLGEAPLLDGPAVLHPAADGLRVLAAAVAARKLFVVHRRNFDMEVDAVEQGAGNALAVLGDLAGGTATFLFRVA